MIPYGRQSIDEEDIRAVVEVLRSDWLTTGPKVAEFERALANFVGAKEAVAVSNGTAALHAAMYALGIGPGDEVIVPPMTFAATANCVVFQGGTPVFADVDPETLLIDPKQVESKLTSRTKAIIAVDFAGHPCEYDLLRSIARKHKVALVADACHALGARYKDKLVGSLADLSVFSFHPVKHVTTGEGGAVTTNDTAFASRMNTFRNHGITADYREREEKGSWFYEVNDLGYNYRLTDFQCALGISQLRKLSTFVQRRQEIARRYDVAFKKLPQMQPLALRADVFHAYHLYVVQLNFDWLQADRGQTFTALRAEGIGANVHYIPIHLHPYYRQRFGTTPGDCPIAEAAYERLISLPIFPAMIDEEIEYTIKSVTKVMEQHKN
jgi:perosamine synthetase